MLRLDQKTSITFPQLQEEKGTSLLDLLEGAIHIITRTPRPFKIRTPFANASVEGTEFLSVLKRILQKLLYMKVRYRLAMNLEVCFLTTMRQLLHKRTSAA
ncbi:FecR domain-containing protein [candidate division WWE3 bacterium]|uniref:FecR domain-containing protein n=1 Tax=candidate division WWE3 bacterium TaxID=2053526 RepID=A0A928Y757_UNCKA|nr:FecR domain-containing protein [candidate division WWE3 bacterium]